MSVGLLAGCGSKSSTEAEAVKSADTAETSKPVEITWWDYPNFQTASSGDYEKKIIKNFNKKYPNIKVNVEMIDFASGPQKLNINTKELFQHFMLATMKREILARKRLVHLQSI